MNETEPKASAPTNLRPSLLRFGALVAVVPQILLVLTALASHSFVVPGLAHALETMDPAGRESLSGMAPFRVVMFFDASLSRLLNAFFPWLLVGVGLAAAVSMVSMIAIGKRFGADGLVVALVAVVQLPALFALLDLAAQLVAFTVLLPNL